MPVLLSSTVIASEICAANTAGCQRLFQEGAVADASIASPRPQRY